MQNPQINHPYIFSKYEYQKICCVIVHMLLLPTQTTKESVSPQKISHFNQKRKIKTDNQESI